MKEFIFTCLCIVVITFMTSCISTTPQTTQGKGNNKLTIYAALEEEQIAYYMEGFREEYPNIDVEIVMDSHGVIASKLLAEKDNPQADIIWGLSAMNMIELKKDGALEAYKPKNYDKVDKKFKDTEDDVSWVGMSVPETAIVVNIATYTHSGSKPAKLAGSGEYPIGITLGYRATQQLSSGEPIEVVFPKEGSGWDLEANALVKKDNIKKEAKLFLDWAISDSAMDRYAHEVAVTSIKTDNPVPKGYSKQPFEQLIKEVDLNSAAKNRSTVLKTWESKYGSKSESK